MLVVKLNWRIYLSLKQEHTNIYRHSEIESAEIRYIVI